MATSVVHRFLRLLHGVAPWRSRYSSAERLPWGVGQPGPSWGLERDVSLSRARSEASLGGDGATFTSSLEAGATAPV